MVFSEEMVREEGILIKCDISDSIWTSVGDVWMLTFLSQLSLLNFFYPQLGLLDYDGILCVVIHLFPVHHHINQCSCEHCVSL